MNKSGALLALFLFLGGAATCSAATTKLEEIASETTPSAYFSTNIKTYRAAIDTAGGDGAVARDGDDIVLGTREGQFYRIAPDLSLRASEYPALNLGLVAFAKSHRYGYVEKGPRLHALLIYKDVAYASYDKYDMKEDGVRYTLAALEKGARKWKEIYASPLLDSKYYAMGSGGRIAALDHYLYFSVGDYSLDRKNKLPTDFAAQNPDLPFGKINRMDLQTGKVEPYVLGNRNPLGLTVDGDTLVITDNGPRGGDSISFLKQGRNYGWPSMSFGRDYRNYSNPIAQNPDACLTGKEDACKKYTLPTYVFVPSVAPTQIIKLDDFAADWNGDFLMGSLKAQSLYRIHMSDQRVLYVEPIYMGQRIRDLVQVKDRIWILDDSGLLQILTADVTAKLHADNSPLPTCTAQCHTVNPNLASPTPYAPNLFGVFGRQAGKSNFSGYSVGMKEAAESIGKWNRDSLSAFLHNPGATIPGTSMPRLPESTSDKDIDGIIDQLQALHK